MDQESAPESGEDHDEGEMLGFLIEDHSVISSLTTSVRALLQRDDLAPRTISGIGVILFALERFPSPTSGITSSLSLVQEVGRERDWISLGFEDDRFVLEQGYYTYDSRVGGDTHVDVVLEVGIGYREGDTFEAIAFAESFASRTQDPTRQVRLDQDADEPFSQWDLENAPDAWERLDSDYL